jgi:hypothetical protein
MLPKVPLHNRIAAPLTLRYPRPLYITVSQRLQPYATPGPFIYPYRSAFNTTLPQAHLYNRIAAPLTLRYPRPLYITVSQRL